MAWTEPKTWSYKESLSNEDLNIYLKDNMIALADRFYPVGTVYINYSNPDNPATYLGFGTWVAAMEGETIVGKEASGTFGTGGALVGEETHLLTGAESGEKGHNHTQNAHSHNPAWGSSFVNYGSGGNFGFDAGTEGYGPGPTANATATNNAVSASNATQAHNNIQPSRVCYVWRRTE